MLKIEFSRSAKKFLENCEKEIFERVIKKIEGLGENAFPSDCVRVRGRKEKMFRIRVGDFRVLYIIFNEKNLLFISEIDKRGKIYK